MKLNGISEEYLESALKFASAYDMPDIYRLTVKLISDSEYEKSKEIISANEISLSDENFGYLILDAAVEHSLDNTDSFAPTAETAEFIEWLLKNGANPNLPENFNQIEHILDLQQDCSQQCGCDFDCSEILKLLKQYI